MSKTTDNPFPVVAYHGPELFCDREEELQLLTDNFKNGINSLLLSVRRMGKTGLIQHLSNHLEKQKAVVIYLDIYSTQNLKDFTNQLSGAIMKAFPEKVSAGKKFMQLIRHLRPTISFDAYTQQPQISFDFAQAKDYEHTLAGMFSFLSDTRMNILIAIDEFQQITAYPEKNMEALLRTHMQRLKNVRFVFSGSSKHILADIFNNSKRPFFSSCSSITLKEIDARKYHDFIISKFKTHKKKISNDAVAFILDFAKLHTYYVQMVCNRVFSATQKAADISLVKAVCYKLLKEQENIYFQYRNLLTAQQWELLKAIAKEGQVAQPTSKHFIRKYDIGTSSHVQRALAALTEKEMVYREDDKKESSYRVYDCFLSRWLENQ